MDANDDVAPNGGASAPSAGAILRRARESAGWSIDLVSQQLKLAPRQVQALEEDDFAQLPGRTFVRGFMRNYARLLHLDADALLSALPESTAAPSLDRPTLTPTTRTMGDLPSEAPPKPSSARWAIPLALVAIVAIALAYEFGRPLLDRGKGDPAGRNPAASQKAAPAPASAVAPAAVPALPAAETPLVAAPAAVPAAAPPETANSEPPTIVAPIAPGTETPLVFVFRGTSWLEVRDAKGTIVLSTMGYPGATHAVGGAFPLDVVLGNAEVVMVTLRGTQFDTTPYVKQNVAKFRIAQ
jgi:cytoskeleton protein RodZ